MTNAHYLNAVFRRIQNEPRLPSNPDRHRQIARELLADLKIRFLRRTSIVVRFRARIQHVQREQLHLHAQLGSSSQRTEKIHTDTSARRRQLRRFAPPSPL